MMIPTFRHLSNVLVVSLLIGCAQEASTVVPKQLDLPNEITIDEIQGSLRSGEYSVVELTQFYLDRIDSLSFNGPELNAVITVNPDALDIANELDQELSQGTKRGPLHGVPVLLKDNINTGDKMPCTAGARAMRDSYPAQDSPIASQLRKAGAVILGKANLSEWANFHSSSSSSGWSALGGQTKNPYDLDHNPCGSSSGSGVAVAANLCVMAIGTETSGSIICPANNNGIVGIKPTVGLISRSGVVPISFTYDTGGPMARTVRDAAIALGTMTAIDSADNRTLDPNRVAHKDYTEFLITDGIRGKRIGYWATPAKDDAEVTRLLEQAKDFLEGQGAELIPVEQVVPDEVSELPFKVMLYEFKDGLNKYFNQLGEAAKVRDMEHLIELTMADSVEMEYHQHDLFPMSQAMGDLNSTEYLQLIALMTKLSREEGIDRVMDEHHLDAIMAPSGGKAWKTDLVNGDDFEDFISSYEPAAMAGYPNISVPMGQIEGIPVGLSFFGRAWSEPVLLEIAYGYEQGTNHRIEPGFK
jgi:amidase